MKSEIRLSSVQLALITSLSALCSAGLTLAAGSLRPSAANAAERSDISQPASTSNLVAAGADDEKSKPGKSCPVVHFEIGCKESAKTKAFYSQLFDWKIDQQGPAGMIDTGSKEGIQGHITSLGHEPEHYVTLYVQVSDIKAYLDKAEKLGGKTLIPPVVIPTGQFAWISDPDGNIVGLLQPKRGASK
ncbi:MAG TPA: VOC family protein [Chthonomonadaceae bacterium]|nr:VOC family protein [Chthonomonadaceae bacterium]